MKNFKKKVVLINKLLSNKLFVNNKNSFAYIRGICNK